MVMKSVERKKSARSARPHYQMGEDIVCSDLERIGGEASQSIAARRSSTSPLIIRVVIECRWPLFFNSKMQ